MHKCRATRRVRYAETRIACVVLSSSDDLESGTDVSGVTEHWQASDVVSPISS